MRGQLGLQWPYVANTEVDPVGRRLANVGAIRWAARDESRTLR